MTKKESTIKGNISKTQFDFPKKIESKHTLKEPSFYDPRITFNNEFVSKISEKKNYNEERTNNFHLCKSGQDYNILNPPLFNSTIQMGPLIFPFDNQSQFQSKRSLIGEGKIQNFTLEPNTLFLEDIQNEKDDFFRERKNEEKSENKNDNILYSFIKEKYSMNEGVWMEDKNVNSNLNMNMNLNTPTNANSNKTKFFTNHNYGYKCSCSKTQCNRKYCECFNSGNYCIDCYCKNCNNKPPINTYTNKHPTESPSKNKKNAIICTCTKSSCNKNYCECFKNGQKCTSLCRCISCENNIDFQKGKKCNYNYDCCMVDSIYILKNKIYCEDIEKIKRVHLLEVSNDLDNNPTEFNTSSISKKRKRDDSKNGQNKKNFVIKEEKLDEIDLFNDSLFDNKGKIVLNQINFIHIEQ
jgi:hypothetical protein